MQKVTFQKYAILWGALFVIATWLFSYQLATPPKVNYDEFHYMPAAKGLLEGQLLNKEHPPVAKYFFALSMATFGDNPIGWRVPSVLFGLITLAGIALLSLRLFQSHFWAVMATLLTLFNFTLYVQARIGMLDTVMTAFLIWGFVFFVQGYAELRLRPLALSGLLFGVAIATKWAAIPTFGLCCLLLFIHGWKSKQTLSMALIFGAVAVVTYLICFLPLLGLSMEQLGLSHLFSLQKEMLDLHMGLKEPHRYSSQWWQWPLLLKPMWYAFERVGDSVCSVLLIGNPVLFWTGTLAILTLIFGKWRKDQPAQFWILFFYLALYAPWILFPRPTSFFYYYYPASLFLGLALVQWARPYDKRNPKVRLWFAIFVFLCFSLFVDFYPILSGIPMPPEAFRRWMWFQSWI